MHLAYSKTIGAHRLTYTVVPKLVIDGGVEAGVTSGRVPDLLGEITEAAKRVSLPPKDSPKDWDEGVPQWIFEMCDPI